MGADVWLFAVNVVAPVLNESIVVIAYNQTVAVKIVELVLRLLAMAAIESDRGHHLLFRAWFGPAAINGVEELAANLVLAKMPAELDAILLVITRPVDDRCSSFHRVYTFFGETFGTMRLMVGWLTPST